jgi:hypothetical protein
MSSARALILQKNLGLLEYCSFSKVVLHYQYQSFNIVLQYKTARLVHPCYGLLFLFNIHACSYYVNLLFIISIEAVGKHGTIYYILRISSFHTLFVCLSDIMKGPLAIFLNIKERRYF